MTSVSDERISSGIFALMSARMTRGKMLRMTWMMSRTTETAVFFRTSLYLILRQHMPRVNRQQMTLITLAIMIAAFLAALSSSLSICRGRMSMSVGKM